MKKKLKIFWIWKPISKLKNNTKESYKQISSIVIRLIFLIRFVSSIKLLIVLRAPYKLTQITNIIQILYQNSFQLSFVLEEIFAEASKSISQSFILAFLFLSSISKKFSFVEVSLLTSYLRRSFFSCIFKSKSHLTLYTIYSFLKSK